MANRKKGIITGANGLLAREFLNLRRHPLFSRFELIPKTSQELDITNEQALFSCFAEIQPGFIINCAAYTNVDKAESEPVKAWQSNVRGPELLAKMCKKYGSKLVHYSTHGVFDGDKPSPYLESDLPHPINTYGRTKFEGEKAIRDTLPEDQYFIIRLSWPFSLEGNNFINTLWKMSETQSRVFVVDDQYGTPNPTLFLALKTLQLLEDASGLFHLSCSGGASRYEVIRYLFEVIKNPCQAIPISTREFNPTPAKRPKNLILESMRKNLVERIRLPSWQKAMKEFLAFSGVCSPNNKMKKGSITKYF